MKRFPLLLTLLFASGSPALAADGVALYNKHCASCHGKQGKNGKDVPVAGLPADRVAANIKDHPLSMNSFKLSDAQIQAIAKYLAALKP